MGKKERGIKEKEFKTIADIFPVSQISIICITDAPNTTERGLMGIWTGST